MKKLLLLLSLAVLAIGLLGSCSKLSERIDNLEKRVDDIESTSIASVQQQIDGIQTSINDLKDADVAIKGKIAELKTTAEAQQKLIDALKEADKALEAKDEELEERITILKNQVATIGEQIKTFEDANKALVAKDKELEERIATLKSQVSTIGDQIMILENAEKALLAKDEELERRISTFESQVATMGRQIKILEDADKAINIRIDELKSYVNPDIDTIKDWATKTFATLEQYQKTSNDLATLSVTVTGISTTLTGIQTSITGLDTKIDGIDTALQGNITAAKTELESKITSLKTELEGTIASAISKSETSIKTWINELLKGYYTIAQVDAKVTSLNTAIETVKCTAKERIDSVATELNKLKTAIDTAKVNIRNEYKNAIATAINEYDGEIRKALKDSIVAVNGRIEALGTRVTTLEGKVLTLEGNVDKLLAMIQSVSITPAYSDGSVEAMDGILVLKCIISPSEALAGINPESLKDSLMLYADSVKVKSKAATSAYMEIEVSDAFILDEKQGVITLIADISNYLPKGTDKALTVALNIKNGISNFTTEFVPVTVTPPVPAPDGFVDLGVRTNKGKPLYWAECNLGASKAEKYGDYFAWGETAPYYEGTGGFPSGIPTWKSGKTYGYDWRTYCGSSDFTEWSNPPYDADEILKPAYDAATYTNSSWRTPTTNEFKALAANCVWIWCDGSTTKYNNTSVKGYIVYKAKNYDDKGKANWNGTWKKWNGSKYENDSKTTESYSTSDSHIFFPLAGVAVYCDFHEAGPGSVYWSSTLDSDDKSSVRCMSLNCTDIFPQAKNFRSYGLSVRPVSE